MINTLPKSLIEAAEKHLTHIDVDGELKHRYNSEGKLIHHTEEGIRNFHRWFGNSNVVDEQGRPKVMYHGTRRVEKETKKHDIAINTFKAEAGIHWFADNTTVSDAHTGVRFGMLNGNTIPVYIKANTHFDSTKLPTQKIKNPHGNFVDELTSQAPIKNKNSLGYFKKSPECSDEYKSPEHEGYQEKYWDSPEQTKHYKKLGFDSIKGHMSLDRYYDSPTIGVFDSSQIKSAIGNDGTFDHPTKISESTTDRPFTQDEHGKNIVYDNGEYKISVNDPHDATYIALWHSGKAVGKMYMEKGQSTNTTGYATIRSIDIDKKHQGKGMGKQMYRTALQYVHDKYKGIGSEQPTRVNKKQVPAIFHKMGGTEHESGDITVDRVKSINESTDKPLTFKVDNPGGEWLDNKQHWAEEDMVKRGGKGYVGKGISGSTTGYFNKPVHLPVIHLINLPGAEGEESFRANPDNQKMANLKDEIGHPDNFDSKKHPIFIGVNHKGDACIMEGNHRLTYAHQNGIKHIHTEVRYYNGGEAVNGKMHPSVLQALHHEQ